MKHISTLILMLAVAMSATAAPKVPLAIKTGHADRTDTVYTPKQYIVGVTDPAAKAWIDGEEVHVYRTGSFGAQVSLKEGLNKFPVKVGIGKNTEKAEVKYFYTTASKPAPAAAEATVALAEPLNIITTDGAYLQYGNGGDRLGGSKMNFIDAGIPMTATGETKSLYKVRLGENGFAYLPKEYAQEGGTGATTYNSGSASLTNMGTYDRITVGLPERVPYYTYTMLEPSTIVVKLYGVTNNTNWLTQRNATGMVDYVDIRQPESDVLEFVIRLKEKYQWGYTIAYEGNMLTIDVRHRPASLALSDLTIGLDAGHGGEYLGAVSPSGLMEKEVNLDIVLKLADMLRAEGAKVVLTRDSDTGPSMTERKRIWRDGGVDLAISVHNNASGNPLIPMGTSCYYKHIAFRPLAKALHDSMLDMGLANFGLTGNFNFSLNGPTDYPNALVEVLFMSSLPEEEILADPAERTKLAAQIFKGLKEWLEEIKN